MHVCGTHEHTIARASLRSFLPEGVRLIAGPGCPVCVCPARDIDRALEAAKRENVVIATFGDMVRVPSSESSFERAKAEGCDIRVVYSPRDAVRLARRNPEKEVVFMAVGFETTAAPIAASLADDLPPQFLDRAVDALGSARAAVSHGAERRGDRRLHPAGTRERDHRALRVRVPRGGVRHSRRHRGFRGDRRAARGARAPRADRGGRAGNGREPVPDGWCAEGGTSGRESAIARFFEEADVPWRGIGTIPRSGLALRREYERLDAAVRLDLPEPEAAVDVREGCRCHLVILGEAEPEACPLVRRRMHSARPVRAVHGLERGHLQGAVRVPVRRGAGRRRGDSC